MRYCVFLFAYIFMSCDNNQDYEYILKSLEKSYVITNVPKKDILFCWNISNSTFVKDSVEYRKGINDFYKQEIPFVKYLLEKKNDNNKFNNWIVTKNPCSSNLSKEDFITNSKASIILIDNLLLGNQKDIIVNGYIKNVSHDTLKEMIRSNSVKSYVDLKRNYIKYINRLKKTDSLSN